ncbi:hypothetical protein [Thiorhodococcus fuscus]|uniref:Uncharacterized protein n=1 Tax=Thiorhodococcus fuscus TaxID=527200 RepID=A0ABW4Y975_9GAMM
MNIDDIVFAQSYDMPIRHPTTDEPLVMADGSPMFVRVLSSDAEPVKALQTRYRNEALRNPGKRLTAEKIERRSIDQLVAGTVGWAIEGQGGPIPFSPEAAREIYSDPKKLWLRNQVTAAIYDDSNFLGESKAA